MEREDQLSGYVVVLRTLARAALRAVGDEPWLHRKRVLAEHAAEDTRRADQLVGLGARDTDDPDPATLEGVYLELKPALAATVRAHLRARDPRDDERAYAALTALALEQERHVDELPFGLRLPAPEPPAGQPARDPFVTFAEPPPGQDEPASAHDELHEAVLAAEQAARAGDAAAAAGHLRRAAALDAQLTRAGTPWGSRPLRSVATLS